MKENFTRFNCDNCKASITNKRDWEFPYEKGWQYIHRLEAKTLESYAPAIEINTRSICEKDKHFCSLKCLMKFIEGKFKELPKMTVVEY